VQQFVELDTLRRNSTTCEVKVSISHAPYSSTAYWTVVVVNLKQN
jgi:hypothetical protein